MKKITLMILFLSLVAWNIDAQIIENFEVDPPTGWTFMQTEGDDPGFVQTNIRANSGTFSFYHDDANVAVESTSWMISPAYTVNSSDELKFYYNHNYSAAYYTENGVWISTNSADPIANPGDFTELLEFGAALSEDAWTLFTQELSAYVGETIYIAFKYRGDFSDELYIDDFSLDAIPSCLAPTALNVANLTNSSAALSWTENGSASSWDVEIVDITAAGTVTGTPTATGVSNPYNQGSLLPSNNYAFYVRADCGVDGVSAWAGPFSFSTLCDALDVPFFEGFNSDSTTENCWTVLNENADADSWNTNYATNPFEGNQSAMINTDFNAGANDDWLITPGLNLTGNERLKFHSRVQSASEPNNFEVLLSTTGRASGDFTNVLMADANYSNTTYVEYIVDLSAYSGTSYIAFHVPTGGLDGWRLYIDEVIVETLPSCTEPSNLAVNPTHDSAIISWNVGVGGTPVAYNWEIQPDNIPQGTTGAISGNTTNTYDTAIGLTIETAYDLFVQTDCGGDGSSGWAGPFSFTTLIAPIVPDYLNDFETYPGTGWFEAGNGDPTTGPTGTTSDWESDDYLGDSANGLAAIINLYSNVDKEWLISPVFDLTGNATFYLNYNIAVTNWNNGDADSMGSDDEVQILVTIDNGTTWTNLATWNQVNQPDNLGMSAPEIDVSAYAGNMVKFAIWATDGAIADDQDYDFHVDSFRVTQNPYLGVDDYDFRTFSYYPNPVENILSLRAQSNIDGVIVNNILGQEVLRTRPNNFSSDVDVSTLKTGAYFVRVIIGNNSKTIKIIKD